VHLTGQGVGGHPVAPGLALLDRAAAIRWLPPWTHTLIRWRAASLPAEYLARLRRGMP